MQLGELFFSLGFKTKGIAESQNYQKQITQTQSSAIGLSNALSKIGENVSAVAKKNTAFISMLTSMKAKVTAAASALVYFTKRASDAAIQIDKMSTMTGLSPDTLQRLSDVAAQTGSNINDIASAVRHLQTESVNIALGRGGNVGLFQYLGIDPHQDPLKIIDQMAAKLRTMPTALGNTLAREMGFSDDLIYMLKNRGNAMPLASQTLVNDRELKRLKEFGFYFAKVWEQSKRVLEKFAAFMTPITTSILRIFDGLGSSFAIVMPKMSTFFESLKKYLPLIVMIGTALFAAFAPVTATVIALILVMEDLLGFFAGKDSIFGRMLSYMTDFKKLLGGIVDMYFAIRKMFSKDDEEKKSLDEEKEQWKKNIGEFIDNSNPMKMLDDISPGLGDKASKAYDQTIDFLKNTGKSVIKALPNGETVLKNMGVSTEKPKTEVINNNSVTINVDGSRSPEETAETIKRELSDAAYQWVPTV